MHELENHGRTAVTRTDADDRIDVLVVTSQACHFCEMAMDILEALSHEYPLRLRTVDMEDAEGAAIIRAHRIAFPPAVLVAGRFHSNGRVSERKLRRHLDELVTGR